MSAGIRRAIQLNADFQPTLLVPKGFESGLGGIDSETNLPRRVVVDGIGMREGPDEMEVAKAASRLGVRFDQALAAYETKKAALLKGGSAEKAELLAQKELDSVAEMVQRAAIEAKGGAVIADMASALTSLGKSNPAALSMIMRRAGNPEVFQPLLNSDLPDIPENPLLRADATNKVAKDRADEEAEKSLTSRDKLPLIYRPSSTFSKPDSIREDGTRVVGADTWKNRFKPKNRSVDDTQTTRIIQDAETGKWREFDPKIDAGREGEAQYLTGSQKTRNKMLTRLAGDQIAQIAAIEGTAKKPTGRIASLPKKVPGKGEARIDENTITTGTGESGQENWSGRKRRPIDNVVDTQNRGDSQRVFDEMERARRTGQKVNLDFVAPFARARIAEIGPDGKLQYPNALPSPEFITGLLIGWHAFPYEFYDKWVDIVRRSYDDWPDYAQNPATLKWQNMVLIPNKSFAAAMKKGVGTPDYPHTIYGPRMVPRPEVTPPSSTPLPKEKAPEGMDEAMREIEEYQRKYSKKPGKGDVSTIYRTPAQSPISGLLA